MPNKNPDFKLSGGGSMFLLRPLTDAAKAWLEENIAGETSWLGDSLGVESRYIANLVDGIQNDGLTVEA